MSRKKVARWIIDMLPKKCVNCGATTHLTYHHIVPVSRGGNDVPSNIAVLCPACHAKADFQKRGTIGNGLLVKEGMERARARGVKLGKPTADYEKIMQMVAEHSTMFEGGDWTEEEVRDAAGVQNVCYCKVKRMMKEELEGGRWNHAFAEPKMVRKLPLYDHLIKRLRMEGKDVASYGL